MNVLSPSSKREYEHEHEKMLCSWIANKPAAWQTKYRALESDNFGDVSLLTTASNDDLYQYANNLVPILKITMKRKYKF